MPRVHHERMDPDNFLLEGVGNYSTTRANLKIQDGCQFMCAFCLIPFARGRERSRFVDDAVREAEGLVQRGHRELVLTGVNIGQYQDQGIDLLGLITRLEVIEGLERIRISSIEPTTIPEGTSGIHENVAKAVSVSSCPVAKRGRCHFANHESTVFGSGVSGSNGIGSSHDS